MNLSKSLDTSFDKNIDNLLYIMNYLFDVLKENKLNKLSDILDEKIIRSIILEIEPEMELVSEKLELVLNDKSHGIRFANFMNVISLFEKYFEYKRKTDLLKYTEKLDLKNRIVVNELIKEDPKMLKRLINLFIVLSSISSKKDTFIDKIFETEDKYMEKYLAIIEKYVTIPQLEEEKIENTGAKDASRKLSLRRSLLINPLNFENITVNILEKFKKEISNLEKEKVNLQNIIEKLKSENDEMTSKNSQLNEKNELLTAKQNELRKELEIAKSNQINREDVLNDMMLINQLKTTIAQRELEIQETKKEYQAIVKNYLDKIAKSKKKREEILLTVQEKINESLEIKSENEKLKAKNKEFQVLKEKMQVYESLHVENSILKNQIFDLKIEKASLESHISKLFTEISQEKETARKNEYLKDKTENKVKELETEIFTIKQEIENKRKINTFLSKKSSHQINFNPNESPKLGEDLNLFELESEYLVQEMDRKVEERTQILKDDIDELKTKKNFLKEENFRLKDENEKFKIFLNEAELKISSLKSENEKLQLEKDKIEVSVKKIELDFKMDLFNMEKEKENIEMKNSQILLKLEESMKIKENLNKELEISREQHNNLNLNLEKFTKEKNELIREMGEVKNEFNLVKSQLEKESKIISFTKFLVSNQKEINTENSKDKESLKISKSKLKEENLNLKFDLEKKDQKIKILSEKIPELERENKNLITKIQENLKQYNQEIKKRKEDFEFVHKAFEDQKSKIIKEHETITNSLYEVIQEFMGIKTEINKKAALRRISEEGNNTIKNFSINK